MAVTLSDAKDFTIDQMLNLYQANHWSSADKPQQLFHGLHNSHTVITAWKDEQLVGLANTLSDGHLVVYYSHVIVHPDCKRMGIGRQMMTELMSRYDGFHQHVLIADSDAVQFFESLGFGPAGETKSMWIFDGSEHT